MYNEITRKLTSLTLMAIMVAGGLTFAVPGVMPAAYAANGELFVSAEAVGNFAGIQVIEIVVDDTDRSDTNEAQGVPNVEINGLDVLMNQGNDGAWYAYVANQLAIENYDVAAVNATFYHGTDIDIDPIGGDAVTIFNGTTSFLKGFTPLSSVAENHPGVSPIDWPFIQTYDIADNTQVTITYGTGSTAESVVLTYDYDDSKDLTLDRNRYPASAGIIVSLDDSLLNLSPTADDYWAFNNTNTYYFLDDDTAINATNPVTWLNIGFEEGPINYNFGSNIFSIQNTTIHDVIHEDNPGVDNDFVILSESDTNDNVFVNYDSNDIPNLVANSNNQKTGSGTIEYSNNHSIILDTFDAVIKFINNVDEWLSGVEIELELIDEDKNLNSAVDEDMLILDGEVPYIKIGEPIHFGSATIIVGNTTNVDGPITNSQIYTVINDADTFITINGTWPYPVESDANNIFSYVNLDFTDLGNSNAKGTFYMGSPDDNIDNGATPSLVTFATDNVADPNNPTYEVVINGLTAGATGNVYFDILSFGQLLSVADPETGDINDNVERINDAFYRFELEETDDNTAKFTGTLEYLMINQLNYNDLATYNSIETAGDDVVIIVNDDMDGADAVRVSYNDVDSTSNDETISVQEDANTHTGSISFDKTSYSSGNTITVTLDDADLNTDSDTPQIYTISNFENWVGNENVWLSQLTFNDKLFKGCEDNQNVGLNSTNFSLIETSKASGIFEGTLQLPTDYCDGVTSNSTATTNGVDIEFEYQDYSDASGNPNETSAKAAVSSNTGSVSLDKTVYGVPIAANTYEVHPSRHVNSDKYLPETPTTVTISVNDPDYNLSANGEDTIDNDRLKLSVKRGSDFVIIDLSSFGDLVEIDPQAGIFELDVEIDQRTDITSSSKLGLANGTSANGVIKQGDIISVEYTDDNDASGKSNTVTDSATFDLRNAVLQTDKSVFIIGSDAIITLIEPDLNLDSDTEETLSLDLIEWDSDAGTTTLANPIFNAQPAGLRETGADTGIFQVIIEIPREVDEGDKLERGEEIDLEYVDNGPAGADFVGDDDEDITAKIYTSNFGASIELDQKVYTWTDKVYITIVAPDHNFDNNSVDEIGGIDKVVQVYTRSDKIKNYKFVETGTDTGIFTGEIILAGFHHDADGDGVEDIAVDISSSGNGPTDGLLPTDNDDGITVTFEFSDNEVAQGSALIRWNIGEVQFLEASYAATGNAIVRVIDPDMNLNPEAVDNFDVNVWSDSAAGGISLSVTETNEATGIFEGNVIFTVTDASSGSRLRVSEGDTVTAEYEDNTLPDPYSTADELDVTATTLIGTIVPPLERAPAGNLRAVDAFGNSLDTIRIDQQIQVTADISNNQDRNQLFAYLVQIQNQDGVTVSLSWLTGSLESGQQFSPAVSWIPEESGDYTATTFVWESVDNPTALSPPVSTVINVTS